MTFNRAKTAPQPVPSFGVSDPRVRAAYRETYRAERSNELPLPPYSPDYEPVQGYCR